MRRVPKLQEAVSGIRSTTASSAECKGLDQDEKYLVLADGFQVYRRLQQGHIAKRNGPFAPGLLKKLEGAKSEGK